MEKITFMGNNATKEIKNLDNNYKECHIEITNPISDGDLCKIRDALCCNNNLESVFLDLSNATDLKEIPNRAFCKMDGADRIVEVLFPNTITKIDGSAFSNCKKLKKIKIPGSVTEICANAFSCCNELTEIEICDGVQKIWDTAFFECVGLTNINLPSSVVEIGDNVFSDCKNLKKVIINALCPRAYISSTAFSKCHEDLKIYVQTDKESYKAENPNYSDNFRDASELNK